jgi:enoyl-CoA hydratase/carnithine racemase
MEFIPRPTFEEYKETFKDFLIMERRDGIISVRMHTNNGPFLWTHQAHNAMAQVWYILGNDPENEVLILTSTGPTWISRGDAQNDQDAHHEFAKDDPTRPSYEFYYYDSNKLVTSLINNIDIPTIGVINGPGFHTEMGLLCDITLCAPDSQFGDGHFVMGWVPGDGQFLVFQELMGLKRAAYNMYTGRHIDAAAALEMGLVNEVLPREELMDRAWELAEGIMSQQRVNRRVTSQLVKRPWKRIIQDDYDLHIANEFYAYELTQPSHDFDELTKEFEK